MLKKFCPPILLDKLSAYVTITNNASTPAKIIITEPQFHDAKIEQVCVEKHIPSQPISWFSALPLVPPPHMKHRSIEASPKHTPIQSRSAFHSRPEASLMQTPQESMSALAWIPVRPPEQTLQSSKAAPPKQIPKQSISELGS